MSILFKEESENETENPGGATKEEESDDSESSIEIDLGSETKGDDQDEHTEEDDNSGEQYPEREVFYKRSKSAKRNWRRRTRNKVKRNQQGKHVTERIDETHPKMKNRQKSRTSSEDNARV